MLAINLLLQLEISSPVKLILIPFKQLRVCSYIMLTCLRREQNYF